MISPLAMELEPSIIHGVIVDNVIPDGGRASKKLYQLWNQAVN